VSKPTKITKIEQRIHRATWQDGILEIFGGLFFLFYAVIIDDLGRGVKPHSAVLLFMLLISSWPLINLAVVKSAFVFPRMGYVEPKVTVPAHHVALLVFLFLLPFVTYVGLRFPGHTINVPVALRWMSVAIGFVLGGFYLGLARKQGDKLYLALAALLVILGLALAQVSRGTTMLLALNSAFLLLYGSYKLFRFIVKHPRADVCGDELGQAEDQAKRGPDSQKSESK